MDDGVTSSLVCTPILSHICSLRGMISELCDFVGGDGGGYGCVCFFTLSSSCAHAVLLERFVSGLTSPVLTLAQLDAITTHLRTPEVVLPEVEAAFVASTASRRAFWHTYSAAEQRAAIRQWMANFELGDYITCVSVRRASFCLYYTHLVSIISSLSVFVNICVCGRGYGCRVICADATVTAAMCISRA